VADRVTDRVTMADVAHEAGVSIMTVSRVLNQKRDVSLTTRRRVLSVIEQLGYRPSGIARGLATQRTGTLGLVVPDVTNPFFADVAGGVERSAHAGGYNVFLCNTAEDPRRELAVLQSLEEKRVDGIVLCSSRLDEATLRAQLQRHPAVVLVNRPPQGDHISTVVIDDETGARRATEHLLATGRQAIGLLSGPAASYSGRRRREGYRAALSAAGLPENPAWVRACLPTVDGGCEQTRALLAKHLKLSALLCYNDLVAVGALRACADLGRRVPDDLAIVGYDDIALAALVTPPLTTCRVPRRELGAQATRLLLNQIGGCAGDCGPVVLQPELIVRASAP